MEEKDKTIEYDEEFGDIKDEEVNEIIDEELDRDEDEKEDKADSKNGNTINIKVNNGRKWLIILIIVAVLVVAGIIGGNAYKRRQATIKTVSDLQKVLKINELSSYQIVYNGIATKFGKDKEPLYYVRYNSVVKAGLDVSKIDIDCSERKKTIKVTLPEVKITDYVVDIGSQEFIFIDKDEDDDDVSSESYKLCIADVKNETKNNKNLYKYARDNAKKIVRGLIEPLAQNEDYKLIVE